MGKFSLMEWYYEDNNKSVLYIFFHPIRTAGLEQEIENLKKKLATCLRENVNLQEELSEAYRIKVGSVNILFSVLM